MSLSQTVYCLACGQTFVSSNTQKCSLCGKTDCLVDPENPDALRDLKARRQEDNSGGTLNFGESLDKVVSTGLFLRRLVMGGLAGAAILALGIALMAAPGLRSDPNSLALGEVCIALPLVAVGGFLLVGVGVSWKDWKRRVNQRERLK